jgi:hypothetical protein
MPEQPRGDRAVRTPRLCAPRERIGRGSRAQSPQIAHRLQQREIGVRKHVGPAEREEQVALSGPGSDAVERIERGIRFIARP